MNKILFAAFFLCSSAAFGQAVLSHDVQPLEFQDHPHRAEFTHQAKEAQLVGNGFDGISSERGEQPLWEFGPVKEEPSLGQVAREFRRQKMYARKASVVFEKEGKD